jgi:hypothetical protein
MKPERVQEIIDTYELPSGLAEKLVRIATQKIEEIGISGFEDTYDYIAELELKFRGFNRGQKLTSCFDDKPKDNLSLHERLGTEDINLQELIEGPESQEVLVEGITASRALEALEGVVDQGIFSIMKKLFSGYIQVQLTLTGEQVTSLQDEIMGRAEQVLNQYLVDGRLMIPRRPIRSVQFDPKLKVTFDRRRYYGNPLAFFQENIDFYGDMSRTQLQDIDHGLYSVLLSTGQLSEAIPTDERFKNHDGGDGAYRGYDSPLDYFKAHEDELKDLTKGKLESKDQGLVIALRGWGQLDEIFPPNFRGFKTALEYYNAHKEEFEGLSRTEAIKKDKNLLETLRDSGEIDEAFPLTTKRLFVKKDGNGPYHGYSCALEAYYDNLEELQDISRGELCNTFFPGLYQSLRRDGHLDLAIPKKGTRRNEEAIQTEITRIKKEQKKSLDDKVSSKPSRRFIREKKRYKSHESPLDYLRAHPEKYGHITGRGQLSKFDQGLYKTLRKWGQIDEAFPRLKPRTWRGYKNPWEFFEAHREKYEGIGLKGLRKEDRQLAYSLREWGFLEKAIPILENSNKS